MRALLLVIGLMACGGTSAPAPNNTPVASATPAKSAEPAPPAAPSSSSAPIEKEKPKGPFHWTDYKGPKAKTNITTKRAWAVIPVGLDGDFSISKLALLEYVRAEGDEHVLVRMGKEQIFVPQAAVQPATPAKNVKKGSVLLVNVAAASAYARATSVTTGDDARVKFQYLWAGSLSEDELPLDDVVLVEDKMQFGQPVAYDEKGEHPATLVYTDKKDTLVLEEGGHSYTRATQFVRVLKVTKPLKKGDKVEALQDYQLARGTVVEVLNGGLQYKVKLDSKEVTLPLHEVGAL